MWRRLRVSTRPSTTQAEVQEYGLLLPAALVYSPIPPAFFAGAPVHGSHEPNEGAIADIDTKIGAQAADEDRRAHVRSVMSRLAELSSHLQSQLNDADWSTKREIICALVQRIEIGPTKVAVVLRPPRHVHSSGSEHSDGWPVCSR